MEIALEEMLKKTAAELERSPNELLMLWNMTRKEITEMNKECSDFCKEIESLILNSNPDLKRLSLLTSNLDCLLFERFIKNRDYIYELFLRADKFLETKGINFLTEAIEREGYTTLTS